VHPAPPQLLAFIMSMLDREPHGRPDLRQVIDFFSLCLQQETGGADSGAALIVPESQPQAPPASSPPARGLRVAAVALAVAAAGAVALFTFLPSPTAPTAPSADATPASARPLGPPPSTQQDAPTEQAVPGPPTLEQELAAGADALSAIQPAVARAAFERALLREPGNAAARAGIAASEKLTRVLDAWSAGMRAETAGATADAKSSYESALALDAQFAPAREGLSRVQQKIRAQAFE
jgi:hypothetical protein